MSEKYNKTLLACYLGFITQAITANFTPLLFLLFNKKLRSLFKHDNPFFLDYTYSKLPVKNYYFIENPTEKFSDHIGQVIEI